MDMQAFEMLSLAELNYLRNEAMALFEQSLAEGRPHLVEAFIETQIAQEPPRLELLREVAEDLHQRLQGLRENHFEVRERVLTTVQNDYSVDISPLVPPNALDSYHLLKPDDAVFFLRQKQAMITLQQEENLRQVVDASSLVAAQLYDDMMMTEYLYEYVMDWVLALNAPAVRRYWSDTHFEPHTEYHH